MTPARAWACREHSVARLVSKGVLSKAVKHQRNALDLVDVERLALDRY